MWTVPEMNRFSAAAWLMCLCQLHTAMFVGASVISLQDCSGLVLEAFQILPQS